MFISPPGVIKHQVLQNLCQEMWADVYFLGCFTDQPIYTDITYEVSLIS